jgi:predicted thioesterase
MKENLLGSTATICVVVEDNMTATLDGNEIHRVYSTFWLAYHAELAARRALEPFFEQGENAIGSAIEIRHRAMTPVGATVDITATVTYVNGTTVRCAITAKNKHTLIAEGMQEQVVLPAHELERRITEIYACHYP